MRSGAARCGPTAGPGDRYGDGIARVVPPQGHQARCHDALRANGGRLTTSRRAIVDAFLGSGGHVTADDLAARVQRTHPETALSTVYRTMEALQRAGLVEHLHTGTGPAVYHLTGHDHHHLVCESCGAVQEASPDLLDAVAARVSRDHGFTLNPATSPLHGLCASCVSEAAG